MKTRMGVAVLALGGVFIALDLTLYHVGIIGQLACSVGSCEKVQLSRWANFLGVPVAAWGLATYLALLVLALAGLQPRWSDSRGISWLLVALSGWSVAFSAWLTYLELWVIHAICIWCVTSAVLMLLTFLLSIADLRLTTAAGGAGD
jgi:uncharacterized membrane protein